MCGGNAVNKIVQAGLAFVGNCLSFTLEMSFPAPLAPDPPVGRELALIQPIRRR